MNSWCELYTLCCVRKCSRCSHSLQAGIKMRYMKNSRKDVRSNLRCRGVEARRSWAAVQTAARDLAKGTVVAGSSGTMFPPDGHQSLSVWRARSRAFIRVLLAVGFVYQSSMFISMYLEYPAIVELEITQPSEVELPAITVCNINEIRSSSYCNRYPQRCGTPDSDPSICVNFPEFCRLVNDTLQVPLDLVSTFRNLSRYEQQVFGHTYKDFVEECVIVTDEGRENCSKPTLVPALSFSGEVPFNCFMYNSLTGKPNALPQTVPISTRISLILNLEVWEYHPSHLSRGAQLSIHSPYHVPSPAGEGHFLNLGTIYRMYVNLSKKELLKSPYKSNCTDYLEQWKANGGHGPVTAKMCREKCKLDKSLTMYGCADYRIDYPHNDTYCPEALRDFLPVSQKQCAEQCSSPCRLMAYEVEVQVADSEGSRKACVHSKDLSCKTLVHIFFNNVQVTRFAYKPRYQPIEILSFIGGYVGLWLGFSLSAVYDFFEAQLLNISFRERNLCRKKRRKSKVSYISPNKPSDYFHKFCYMK